MMQLKMIFDKTRAAIPAVPSLMDGFILREWTEKDREAYIALRASAGFDNTHVKKELSDALSNLRPHGFLLIEEISTGALAASAMSRCGYFKNYDNLSWVMTHPDYRGRSFARLVCTKALENSLSYNADGMTLATDDFREPALRMYLKLGWRPWLYTLEDDMNARWETIAEKLNIPEAKIFHNF